MRNYFGHICIPEFRCMIKKYHIKKDVVLKDDRSNILLIKLNKKNERQEP